MLNDSVSGIQSQPASHDEVPAIAAAIGLRVIQRVGERLVLRSLMVLLFGAFYLIAGCGDPAGGASGGLGSGPGADCAEGGVGDLSLTILDDRLGPNVQVLGPDGFAETVNFSETIYNVPSGRYQVLAETVTLSAEAGDLAGSVFSASPESVLEVCVGASDVTEVELEYSEHPGSGMLWVVQNTRSEAEIAAFHQSKLMTEANVDPDIRIELASGNPSNNIVGLSFDLWGNLWVATASTYGDSLIALTPGQLAEGGSLDPKRIIKSEDFEHISDLERGPQGGLWTVDSNTAVAVRFGTEQLVAALLGSEQQVQEYGDTVIESPVLERPRGIDFDYLGNMWVADYDTSLVHQFRHGDLLTSDSVEPYRTIRANNRGDSFAAPVDLAFTNAQDLWVPYFSDNDAARFTWESLMLATPGGFNDLQPGIVSPARAGVVYGVATDALGGAWTTHRDATIQRHDGDTYSVTSDALASAYKLTFYP